MTMANTGATSVPRVRVCGLWRVFFRRSAAVSPPLGTGCGCTRRAGAKPGKPGKPRDRLQALHSNAGSSPSSMLMD
jgi:hypothetical protein